MLHSEQVLGHRFIMIMSRELRAAFASAFALCFIFFFSFFFLFVVCTRACAQKTNGAVSVSCITLFRSRLTPMLRR